MAFLYSMLSFHLPATEVPANCFSTPRRLRSGGFAPTQLEARMTSFIVQNSKGTTRFRVRFRAFLTRR